jgi:hypothetical protein
MSSSLIIGVAEHQSSLDNGVFQMNGTGCPMIKYCIALVSPQRAESHLRVGEFPAAERALELAELIAYDLGIEAGGKWWGWTVEVRSPQGRTLSAVAVAGPDLHQVPNVVSGSPAMAMGASSH